ncbi:hypothetical protein J1N35_012114 [Gossypium stocksii]|uniref:Uncharacterized protein n=1 Tax=Gossypium stocksii TaxID=47602 RepID=A0A9D4AE85_9ROSI|nr:hypothetical protein J1N35_012114 [Gossypium stocksii]
MLRSRKQLGNHKMVQQQQILVAHRLGLPPLSIGTQARVGREHKILENIFPTQWLWPVGLRAAETIPSISFSHYLFSSAAAMQQCYCPPLRSTSLSLESTTEFEFDVRINNGDDQECYFSSANELFSNGKILPLQIKKQLAAPTINPPSMNQNQSSNQAVWQFKRSSSLCPSTPKVKPDGHRSRNKKSSFKHGSYGHGNDTVTINHVANVPLVDVFCVSSFFLTGNRKK